MPALFPLVRDLKARRFLAESIDSVGLLRSARPASKDRTTKAGTSSLRTDQRLIGACGIVNRDTSQTDGAPRVPWDMEFRVQCNESMLRKVRRYACWIAASVAEAGGIGGDSYAEELVQDALVDTLAGVLTWDPAAATLESHLMSRLRSRGRDERRRALLAPHLSIDEQHEDDGESSTVLDEAEEALSQQNNAAEEHARSRMLQVRAHAAADPDMQAVLHAIYDGVEGKSEILAATGLSEKAYRNARVRLCRLRDQLFGVYRRGSQEETPS